MVSAGTGNTPDHATAAATAASANSTAAGTSSVRGRNDCGVASIDSSHTRATSSASAGNAGSP